MYYLYDWYTDDEGGSCIMDQETVIEKGFPQKINDRIRKNNDIYTLLGIFSTKKEANDFDDKRWM